jgi:hypothetical protein
MLFVLSNVMIFIVKLILSIKLSFFNKKDKKEIEKIQ